MRGRATKTEIINNVIVAMSRYITDSNVLGILEKVIREQLVRVEVQEIPTLPTQWQDEASKRNQYLIQLFILRKKNLGRKTMEGYLNTVKRLIVELNNKPLDQVDAMDIEWYLSQYEQRKGQNGEKIEASTYNNERRFLSAFFGWMRKMRIIEENPVESTEPKKEHRKPIDYYQPEEIIRLRDACRNVRERAIIETFRSTGARVGEIAEIKIDQINTETGEILIQGEKSGRYRMIYLDDDARHYYRAYLETRTDDSPYMFTHSRKPYGKMTTCGYRTIIKAVGQRAGLTCRVYPHKSRKTLGMQMKEKEVDLGIIQEILGHASPETTSLYYAQSTSKKLREVRERL